MPFVCKITPENSQYCSDMMWWVPTVHFLHPPPPPAVAHIQPFWKRIGHLKLGTPSSFARRDCSVRKFACIQQFLDIVNQDDI